MKTLKINDTVTVSGMDFKIISIRWSDHGKTNLVEKDEILYPALDWSILKTDKGELVDFAVTNKGELQIKGYCKNGLFVKSNQYGFPCSTYWYIENKFGETYHHKDNKWRKKPLQQMKTFYFTNPATAINQLNKLHQHEND